MGGGDVVAFEVMIEGQRREIGSSKVASRGEIEVSNDHDSSDQSFFADTLK